MLDDCARACKPKSMEIRGVFNSRGGIQTTASARLEGRAAKDRRGRAKN